ncbi:hypothetical protein D4764_12G0010130 [Takifugu flavidus]|uniref:Uncharacterized protein n=1 Tax=Takifugu flavidus TaxID=433684 RepID=A0A5C6PDR8_9TELE|nr:hypothetical protein D4764_12G0010130 [Takifugu flavidus]
MSFLCRVAGLSLRDRVRSSAIREELGVEPLLLRVERSQIRWLGLLVRMPPGRLPGEVFRAFLSGTRPPGRPRTRWRDYVSRLAAAPATRPRITVEDGMVWYGMVWYGMDLLPPPSSPPSTGEMDLLGDLESVPADYQERVAIFRTHCRNKITAPSHITNMDEIPLTFDIPLTHKVEKKGPARWR